MVFDGPWPGNAEIRALTATEIGVLTKGEIDIRFPASSMRVADWTLGTTRDAVQALLADPEVDLVIAWGVLASHTLCCIGAPPKPVIAPVILDVALQAIPFKDGTSGVHNLSYVSFPDNTANELRTFREIVPFDKVTFLVQKGILNAIPDLAHRTQTLVGTLGIEASYVAVGNSADAALRAIPEDTQAVYVWPQLQLDAREIQRLVDGLNARQLPSFSALASASFEAGMLASMASEDFFPRLARRVALNAQRILLGEDAGSLPVAFPVRSHLTLNLATAQAIGVSPRWEMLVEARLLGTDALEGLQPITLERAVREAIAANLDLRAEARAVSAGAQDPRRARAAERPGIELSLGSVTIDEDRAGFGQAEQTLSAQLQINQQLYDDQVSANIAIEDRLQLGREAALETLRLDIARDAAVTYLDLLRAKSLAEVQRSNLALTRSNLERAEIRRFVGAANPAEVFRWQSQIAGDRQVLIAAMATVQTAEIALSRLLDRELQTRYHAAEVDLDDPLLITGESRFNGYIETPKLFRTLSDFTVGEGLASAPELLQLRAGIAAQERRLKTARRAFYLPRVVFQGTLEQQLQTSGVGTDGGVFGLGDDTSWSLSLGATLPLFTGGARRADRIQAEQTLAQLQHQLEATTDRIEQRIRTAMVAARASFAAIALSQEAADAARRNLDLVSDSYSRGALSIIDLLDAQNATLFAERAATNATHDFLIDLMEVQRAANRFDFFTSPAARNTWFERLDHYFARAGVAPWPRPESKE